MVEMPEFGKILPFPTRDGMHGVARRGVRDGRAERTGMASTLLAAVNACAEGGGEGYFPIPNAGLHIIRAFPAIDNHYVYQPSLCIDVAASVPETAATARSAQTFDDRSAECRRGRVSGRI